MDQTASQVRPDPDLPEDPDREEDLPEIDPSSKPHNPGEGPAVTEPGDPPRIIARTG